VWNIVFKLTKGNDMYDAIVVGARCAGSPTAMLLARQGHRVLLVDRASFPSDTLSTHYIHQPGVACLERWGLLPQIARSGCPPIRSYTLDVGPFALEGTPPPIGDVAEAYSPRRSVLDRILVEAAAEAGAEVRQRFSVQELVTDGDRVVGIRGRSAGGALVTERARIVIGADGMNSLVARGVGARIYNERPTLTCAYYTYWSGVEMEGVELYPRPGRMIVASPTNDGKVVTIVFWPSDEFHQVRSDIERNFLDALELAPGLAERARNATRSERFRGTSRLPNHFRRPYGQGWALVGDAGYHKDPILALGIADAFRDAELLAGAIDAGLSGGQSLELALARYERRRNEVTAPGFESTVQFARLEAPPADMQQLFAALRHDQEQANRFFGTFAGTVPAAEFFAPANVAQIIGGQEEVRPPRAAPRVRASARGGRARATRSGARARA
jgi:2-polyprenyl-6-methoxyphenol hydroxylase-like FAD-dependent oxidoreductase